MSSINTLHIGRTGLKVASYGVEVTGQNVTNASTEGYVRRRIVNQTRVPHRSPHGHYKGQGVTVSRQTVALLNPQPTALQQAASATAAAGRVAA